MSERWRHWMRTDLVGIPVTLVGMAIFGLAIVLFLIGGSLAGVLIGGLVVALGLYLVVRLGADSDATDVGPPAAESAQRVLVIANQGLQNPALLKALHVRRERGPLEALLIVPVLASTPGQALADDIDTEAAQAQHRLDAAIASLAEIGIDARGHIDDEASPRQSLLDGLREFPADEVLLLPGDELDWSDAEGTADRVQAETDITVTEIGS